MPIRRWRKMRSGDRGEDGEAEVPFMARRAACVHSTLCIVEIAVV